MRDVETKKSTLLLVKCEVNFSMHYSRVAVAVPVGKLLLHIVFLVQVNEEVEVLKNSLISKLPFNTFAKEVLERLLSCC